MSNETVKEYILGKQALAQLDVCPFGNSQMTPIELVADDHSLGYLRKPINPAIINLIGGVLLLGAQTRAHAEPFFFSEYGDRFIAVSRHQSDSQQLSQRAQRASDIRAVNLQAQAPLARVYEFERSFPDEGSYNPRMPETPRILKLRK